MTRGVQRSARHTWGDQIAEFSAWFRQHPFRGLLILALAAGAVATILNPPIQAATDRLNSGDCLYARTAAADDTGPGARPIGDPTEVEAVVMTGAADRAACGLSHGHEVSLNMAVSEVEGVTGSGTAPIDRDALRALVQRRCDLAFHDYIGHSLTGSAYVTFAAVPTADDVAAGRDRVLCLIGRADGQWMTSPARDSGQ
jgi:hypothetical protein